MFTSAGITLIGLMAIMGYRRGGIVSLLAVVLMLLGAVPAAVIAAAAFGSRFTSLGAVVGALGVGVLFALRVDAIEARVGLHVGEDMRQFDRVAGGVVSATVATTVIWLVAAVATLSPSASELSKAVRRSEVSSVLLGVVPPTGGVASVVLRSGLAPSIGGATILVDSPDDSILVEPSVTGAEASVVRVVGRACTDVSAGSGWVVAPHFVITNAHVVAGMLAPKVLLQGRQPLLDATVRAFDPLNDLAVLEVPALTAPPLSLAMSPPHGVSTAVIGFPKEEGLSITPARFDRQLTIGIADIYDRGSVEAPIVLFRGDVRPGNSGSPMVDAAGHVVATIAAHALNQSIDGGFAVPNVAVNAIFRNLGPQVSTGPCITEKPTAVGGAGATASPTR